MNLNELAVKHDYYASDSNYYSNDCTTEWDTWTEFYAEFNNVDIDMNLIFRWDVDKDEERYILKMYMIHQRKGIYAVHIINSISESDTNKIVEYLRKHKEKLISIWKPL